MDDLPQPDDDDVAATERQTEERQRERQRRVALGLDDRIQGAADTAAGATAADAAGASSSSPLTIEQYEAKWGFSLEELRSATKVVSVLFQNPALFVGDPHLAESRLYTMISRDRKAKRDNLDTYKQIMAEERSRRKQTQKQEDAEAIRKTQMKKERDAALAALLLPPPPSDDDDDGEDGDAVKQITVRGEKSQTAEAAAAAAASPHNSAAEGEDGVITMPATASATLRVHKERGCHICHVRFRELHHYYYNLCPTCGDFNFQKRSIRRDLRGKNVLLTGCRIKIGYAMAVSLLRQGATLLGTTRFVHDCLRRFMEEPDYAQWKDRIHLFAIDLRDMWMVTQFCAFLHQKFKTLFAIINNAAQTIARTVDYTAALRHFESQPVPKVRLALKNTPTTMEWMEFCSAHSSVPIGIPMELSHPLSIDAPPGATTAAKALHESAVADGKTEKEAAAATRGGDDSSAAAASTVTYAKPRYDRYDTQAEMSDVREKNSWTTELADVNPAEAAEVMAINALSPMIMNAKLKPMLLAGRDDSVPIEEREARFIINVSAMEGQFYRFKQTTHPHTNMAKAALNMMTRTSAPDYAKDAIFMNAVDTGWITDESPVQKKERRDKESKLCPLDEVDAASRCLDLIYSDSREFGKFWKDYREIPW